MKAFGRSLPFVALLGPALLVLAALALYPVAQVLIDSFCRVDYAAGRRAFAGLANYRAVLGDDAFTAGFGNTLRFTIVASLAESRSVSASRCCSCARFRGGASRCRSRSCR